MRILCYFKTRPFWSGGSEEQCIHLQESIAVTQNFVSSAGLRQCMAFLKTGNPDLVSGCLQEKRGDLHERFLAALQEQRPEVR